MAGLKSVWMNKQAYWKIRGKLSKVLFAVRKSVYNVHSFFNNQKSSLSVQVALIIQTVKKLILASFLLIIVYALDFLVFDILGVINPLTIQREQLLTDILIAALSISGIFLGLYFSNMATVYSSRYANAPVSVRQLFENEIVTSSSVNDIILFIIVSIVALILNLFGVILKPVTICFIFFLSIKNIVSFAIIGKRSFQFSDVFEITAPLYKNIRKCYISGTFKGMFFKEISFQAHYQSSARQSIDTLSTITTYGIESGAVKSSSMLTFMCKNLEAIREYWESKTGIPFDSKWFPDKEVYKKWFEADDSEIEIAMSTGTSIRNKVETDKFWFEDRLFAINDVCFEYLKNMKNWEALSNYIWYTRQLVFSAIASGCSSYYLDKVNQTLKKIQLIILENKAENNSPCLQLIDGMLMCYIEFYVGSQKYIEKIKQDEIYLGFSQGKIGLLKHPILNSKEIRTLSECVLAEKKIERKTITPDWYIRQLIAQKTLEAIYALIDDLKEIYITQLKESIEESIKNKNYTEALLILSRMTEVKSRFLFSIKNAKPVIQAFEAFHVDTTLAWPKETLEDITKDFCSIDKALPRFWVTTSVAFTIENKSNMEQYPDLIGHCYNVLCNLLVTSIASNDYDSFESAYSRFWSVMMLYQEITRLDLLKIKDAHEESLIFRLFAFPMVEFCMISGFAILWGDLLKNQHWLSLVNAVRDQIAARKDDEPNLFKNMIDIVTANNKSFPALYPRDLIQTNWVLMISNALRENKTIQYEADDHFGEKRINTEDPYVQKFLSHNLDMIGLNPIYELYLIKCINPYVEPELKYRSHSRWERDLV